jgi:putative membrane protein
MIVRNGAGVKMMFREYILKNWVAIILITSVGLLMRYLDDVFLGFQATVFSSSAVSMLATVVGIFLVFRFDNAYQRWWEARKLWGQLVNSSRTFARQVSTLLSPERVKDDYNVKQLATLHKTLIYRQIAFVNALRMHLREELDSSQLEPFLDEAELALVEGTDNIPCELLNRQAAELAELLGGSVEETMLLMQFDNTLTAITDTQGACERINNTVFPDMVSHISRYFVWGMAFLIPAVFLEPDEHIYLIELITVLFMAMAFIIVQQLAVSLMNPFDNKKNDTPMSALCRTIERDLKRQLGETDLPEPVKPVKGILM